MAAYKLIYFNTKGRAEVIRLVFAVAGVEYEDCRLTSEEWKEFKSSGKPPFGQLPILEVDGKILAQSDTILKYVARETGLAPTASFEIAKADMIVDGIGDLMQKALRFFVEKNEEKKKSLTTEFYEKDLPHALEMLEKILKSHGGKYFADNKQDVISALSPTETIKSTFQLCLWYYVRPGLDTNISELTYADIKFFSCLELLFHDIKEDVPPILDKYPALKNLYSTVSNNPGIKKWLSQRPAEK